MGKIADRLARKQQARSGKIAGTPCRLLIQKYDERDGSTEFQYGEIEIPTEPLGDRNRLIGSLGQKWLHAQDAFLTVAAYLSHSPSLKFMRMGVMEKAIDLNTGHHHNTDVADLACYIQFQVDRAGVHTKGPQWMRPEQVQVLADLLAQKHASTHDIRRG